MKHLPEFPIESISAIEEKKREDKISMHLRADLSPARSPPFDDGFLKYLKNKIVARLPV